MGVRKHVSFLGILRLRSVIPSATIADVRKASTDAAPQVGSGSPSPQPSRLPSAPTGTTRLHSATRTPRRA